MSIQVTSNESEASRGLFAFLIYESNISEHAFTIYTVSVIYKDLTKIYKDLHQTKSYSLHND